jgi:hypothetical protein
MFNIITDFSDDNTWKCNNSFLKINNNETHYKFEWINNDINKESFINENIIKKYIEEFKWNIIYYSKIKYIKNIELSNLYSWWIIEKI